jgi:hypothetical protein
MIYNDGRHYSSSHFELFKNQSISPPEFNAIKSNSKTGVVYSHIVSLFDYMSRRNPDSEIIPKNMNILKMMLYIWSFQVSHAYHRIVF